MKPDKETSQYLDLYIYLSLSSCSVHSVVFTFFSIEQESSALEALDTMADHSDKTPAVEVATKADTDERQIEEYLLDELPVLPDESEPERKYANNIELDRDLGIGNSDSSPIHGTGRGGETNETGVPFFANSVHVDSRCMPRPGLEGEPNGGKSVPPQYSHPHHPSYADVSQLFGQSHLQNGEVDANEGSGCQEFDAKEVPAHLSSYKTRFDIPTPRIHCPAFFASTVPTFVESFHPAPSAPSSYAVGNTNTFSSATLGADDFIGATTRTRNRRVSGTKHQQVSTDCRQVAEIPTNLQGESSLYSPENTGSDKFDERDEEAAGFAMVNARRRLQAFRRVRKRLTTASNPMHSDVESLSETVLRGPLAGRSKSYAGARQELNHLKQLRRHFELEPV